MADFFKPTDGVRRTRTGKRERITISTAALPLTVATYAIQQAAALNQYQPSDILPVAAVIQVIAQPINFTTDGTTPTSTLGFLAAAADIIYLNSYQEVQRFRAIRNGASDATLEVTYFYGR